MKSLLTPTVASVLLLLGASKASALTTALYKGYNNSSPTGQGWFKYSGGTETIDPAGVTLNTNGSGSDFSIQDGYFRASNPLNRAAGYNLRFSLQLLNEARSSTASNNTGTDGSDDRAGLSIIVLSSDRQGIELGFWEDRIWAQQDGAVKADPTTAPTGTRFTQAEGVPFATTALTQYDLSILGSTYYLYANGNYATPLFSDRLRDYTPEGSPYTIPNFIFVGDNTTSARGSFRLNQVELSDSAITPVPFAFNPLFGFGWFGLSRLRKAIAKKKESASCEP